MRAGIQELSVKGETIVHEGIYKLELKDRAGSALGVIVLIGGRVVGTDGGVDYDGTIPSPGLARFRPVSAVRPVRARVLSRGRAPSQRRLM